MKKAAKEEERQQLICRLRGDPGRGIREESGIWVSRYFRIPPGGSIPALQAPFPLYLNMAPTTHLHSPPHTQNFDSSNANPGSVSRLMLPVLEHPQVGMEAPQSQALLQLLQLANPHACV